MLASIFPVLMFVLFICSRRYSLFTEFILDLLKLGLLSRYNNEHEINYQRRIYAYLQKFQEYYGQFSQDMKEKLSKRIKEDDPEEIESMGPLGFKSCLTPESLWYIPIVFTILLIAVGWVITLPPWQTGDGTAEIIDPLSFLTENERLYPIDNNISNVSYSVSDKNTETIEDPVLNGLMRVFNITRTPVTFAFLGAYFYSMQILVRRFLRRDFRINVFITVSQRIILGIIATWVIFSIPAILSNNYNSFAAVEYMGKLNFLGFIIGAFPSIIWNFLKKHTADWYAFCLPDFTERFPLTELDGLDVWAELRFQEEDISNVPSLATADIVDLMLITRFPGERLIFWIDQAILYMTLGMDTADNNKNKKCENKTPIQNMGAIGIRTATSLIDNFQQNRSTDLWNKAGYTIEEIQSIITSIEANPNIRLIQAWRRFPSYERHCKCDPASWFLL
ncbi:hypothetical protein [Methanolobus profundi]|nr:hypothetical protein [Methanolobus profundi]